MGRTWKSQVKRSSEIVVGICIQFKLDFAEHWICLCVNGNEPMDRPSAVWLLDGMPKRYAKLIKAKVPYN